MKIRLSLLFILVSQLLIAQKQDFTGYYNFQWDPAKGTISLEVDKLDQEFLYVNSLAAGIGSNDIGLDRGQLGGEQIVKFMRSGNKILMVQPNYKYRADSDNMAEKKAVQEAFAQSVLWGFKIESEEGGKIMIDLTPFLLRDSHGVVQRLKRAKQGTYKLDASRSAIYLPRTKSFPKNSEFEAVVTFVGQAEGAYIRSVTPSSDAVSVRMHHSFIELPDDKYTPRAFHPFSGFNQLSYFDYASPIYENMDKKYIRRHRLEKKDPSATLSEAVDPIVYYLDPGTPEPVRSALLEGGQWWNQAFEAAGYKDAFQVKVLPEDADPLDVRYNVIQWVHRSTRGWSYGSSISDPRTGEIIKGHVSLGSLRVRQDFLIAQGLVSPYGSSDDNHSQMMELALARLRQLSAHEIGHTIGLAHNFASSVNDRASVMDYPHPLANFNSSGNIDFSNAYEVGIGDWDKRTILYGYQDFPDKADETAELKKIINKTINDGYLYMSDQDSRPVGGAHPHGHLWDNGKSAAVELERLSNLRAKALANFGENSIPTGTPFSMLENVLVPIYLAHRYQVEAVAKLIGGVNYSYALKGDPQEDVNTIVDPQVQRQALNALLGTLNPSFLEIPENILKLIPPPAYGYGRNRETFERHTKTTFDPLAPAEGSANNSFIFLLNSDRLTRIIHHSARDSRHFGLEEYFGTIVNSVFTQTGLNKMQTQISKSNQRLLVMHLLKISRGEKIFGQVAAEALAAIDMLKLKYLTKTDANSKFLLKMVNDGLDTSKALNLPPMPEMPPGSPIGCG